MDWGESSLSGVKPRLFAGSVLARRYVIESLIGSGGMGNVYLATDRKLQGKRWAVKEAYHAGSADAFVHEARMLTALAHPNLPHIVDFIAPNREGYSYIVMEYIDGETLAAKFQRQQGRLDVSEVRRIGIQICDILTYLHLHTRQFPIVYRDLKPSNIMVSADGHVKLIDFGIAKQLSMNPSGIAEHTVQMGTFGFAAPEQYEGASDERTDLYNLGALLYYLLSGGRYAVPGKPLSAFRNDVDKRLREVTAKLLAPNPADRYTDALAARKAIAQTGNGAERLILSTDDEADAAHNAGPARILVVGGLYRGCGSTFVSVALASAIQAAYGSCALLEFPTKEPVHYAFLSGESKRTWGAESLDFGGVVSYPSECFDAAEDETAAYDDWERKLSLVRETYAVVDISTMWDDADAQGPLERADMIFIVADPSFVNWTHAGTEKRLRMAVRWVNEGKRLIWTANRDMAFKSRKRWLKAFPYAPELFLPDVHGARLTDALWRAEDRNSISACFADLQPHFRKIIKQL